MAQPRRPRGTTATAHPAALDTAAAGVVERHWHLVQHPFRLTPDAEFVFETAQYREALARLLYDVVEFNGGLSVVTGESGTGKSTLARALLETLPRERYRAALVVNPLMPVPQLFATILEELGVESPPRRKADLLDEFAARVEALDREGIQPVLVLDEAHTLRRTHLEELRLLLNFEAGDRKLFHMILVGHPELTRKLKRDPAFDERITMRCHLGALTESEGVKYLRHRLQMAGAIDEILTPKAASRVVKRAEGNPRRMNLLAGTALYSAAIEGATTVTVEMVDRAYRDHHSREADQ